VSATAGEKFRPTQAQTDAAMYLMSRWMAVEIPAVPERDGHTIRVSGRRIDNGEWESRLIYRDGIIDALGDWL
jgi:hypothetical protein